MIDKPRLDPMLRRWGIKIPYLRFTYVTPTQEDIRKIRVAAGLTQAQAAQSVGLGAQERWAEYENGARVPDVARWALFLLIVRQHPEWRLKRTKHQHLMEGSNAPPKT
jgi:predicted transcriptional regulator